MKNNNPINPLFSVIVPTHNGEDRLPASLASVTNQTFKNYELIVVCDACDDDSIRVASKAGAKVIEVDCHRDGLARNAGIDEAQGEWILFLDDDDYFLHEYCFELLAKQIGKNDEDVLDFAFIWKGEGYKVPSRDECFVMAWCRAWRRSFIGDNRFDDMPYGSDKRFFQKMIQNNPDVTVSYWNMPMYYYNYLREGSLSWMEKKKTLLDIIVTHYDEPWELGKRFFDMLEHQQCADLSDVCVTLVQDGSDTALPWKDLLSQYSYKVKIVTIDHAGVSAARNAGIANTSSDWITFFNFDDALADVCSLDLILRNLPTDEYNIIWGKLVHEEKWYTGVTYLNASTEVDFTNTDGKLYRRAFLNEHNIRFPVQTEYFYDNIFNDFVIAKTEQWKIAHMTSDIFPFFKSFRPDSTRHTLDALTKIKDSMFNRDRFVAYWHIANSNPEIARRALAKAVIHKYYDICTYDHLQDPVTFSDEFLDFFNIHKEFIMRAINSADFDVISADCEVETINLVQTFYNEHKIEYYLRNNDMPFEDWLRYLETYQKDSPSTIMPAIEQSDETVITEQPEPEPIQSHDPRVVVYCGTFDVYLNMVASCKSLLANTPVDKVYFLIEEDIFPYDLPDIVETINVKDLAFRTFDQNGPNFNNSWTYMCMIRAAFPELFPQYSKILSLDIDIVINDNVSDLWKYDLSDYYLAGVPERQRQKSSADPIYINFGVVMMNLDKLRSANLMPHLIQLLNTQKLGCPEQDAFNKLCAGSILHIPSDFNVTAYSHITADAVKERIIHYAGQKFWRHYSNVKKYADQDWDAIMQKQYELQRKEYNYER